MGCSLPFPQLVNAGFLNHQQYHHENLRDPPHQISKNDHGFVHFPASYVSLQEGTSYETKNKHSFDVAVRCRWIHSSPYRSALRGETVWGRDQRAKSHDGSMGMVVYLPIHEWLILMENVGKCTIHMGINNKKRLNECYSENTICQCFVFFWKGDSLEE